MSSSSDRSFIPSLIIEENGILFLFFVFFFFFKQQSWRMHPDGNQVFPEYHFKVGGSEPGVAAVVPACWTCVIFT